MVIDGTIISSGFRPYIVAEIGCCHGGSLENAKILIKAAKSAGADAAKLQCYTADSLTIDCDKPDFVLQDGPWRGRKIYELYEKAHTPREWFKPLFDYAREIGITVFASVFCEDDVDFLERLYCPAYKIASMEIGDTMLIDRAIATNRPVIVSTGMATDDDIQRVVARNTGNIMLLHCVSGYPSETYEANLHMIGELRKHNILVGLSDHSAGLLVPMAATALGAVMIEKHIKMDLDVTSEDSHFAMTTSDFTDMVRVILNVHDAVRPNAILSDASTQQMRRSLYVVKDMKAGDKFTKENVRSIRPAYGMAPHRLPDILSNGYAFCDIERGTPLRSEMVEWK